MSAHSNSPLTSPSRPRKLSPQTKPISAGSMSNRDEGSDTKRGRQSSARFQVKELGKETWPDFERMVEKHNGPSSTSRTVNRNFGLGSTRSTRRSLSEQTSPTQLSSTMGPMLLAGASSDL